MLTSLKNSRVRWSGVLEDGDCSLNSAFLEITNTEGF